MQYRVRGSGMLADRVCSLPSPLQAVVLRAKCLDLGTAAELAVGGQP